MSKDRLGARPESGPDYGRAQDVAEIVYLNQRDRDRGFTKMKWGVLLLGTGTMASIGGLGIVGVPLAVLGGLLFSNGVNQGVIDPANRWRDLRGR